MRERESEPGWCNRFAMIFFNICCNYYGHLEIRKVLSTGDCHYDEQISVQSINQSITQWWVVL